jgi:xanthine/CO dehydrogenase XdhC/CoxF family maturation factor
VLYFIYRRVANRGLQYSSRRHVHITSITSFTEFLQVLVCADLNAQLSTGFGLTCIGAIDVCIEPASKVPAFAVGNTQEVLGALYAMPARGSVGPQLKKKIQSTAMMILSQDVNCKPWSMYLSQLSGTPTLKIQTI